MTNGVGEEGEGGEGGEEVGEVGEVGEEGVRGEGHCGEASTSYAHLYPLDAVLGLLDAQRPGRPILAG